MREFTIDSCRSIVSGTGSLARLGAICRALGMSRVLIVTDAGIRATGILDTVERQLHDDGLSSCSFSDVIADPPDTMILRAVDIAVRSRIDGIVGLGGGSSMDTAKLVALLSRSGEVLSAIYGVDKVSGARHPLVLIPTTAGTGSEVTPVAIVTTAEGSKQGVVASQLIPDVALFDATLTLGLPPRITAMTGIDAMVHAVEAYTSLHRKNPYTDMLAREALRLLSRNIVTATRRGDDLEARQAMLLGACLAGQAFANAPVAAVHALAYPLGGRYHIPHGLSNSLVLPQVLRFNATAAATSYAELAEIVVPAQRLAATPEARCAQLADHFTALIDELELPSTLSAVGVAERDLPLLASEAMLQQRLLVNNPRPVTERDALAIYRAAWR